MQSDLDANLSQELHKHLQEQQERREVGGEVLSKWLHNRKLAITERNKRLVHLSCKPIYLDIELNNMCNLKCNFCTSSPNHVRDTRDKNAKITLEEIDKISELFPYAEVIETSKGGEPFLTPSLFMYSLNRIREVNPFAIVHTVTNGTILPDNLLENLIHNKLDHIYISINGDSRESYQEITGEDKFDRVVRHLAKLTEAKKKANVKEPYIHFNTQLCKFNDPFSILQLAHQYNVVEVNFIKTQISESNSHFAESTLQSFKDPLEIEIMMDEIVKAANKLGISVNFGGWNTKPRQSVNYEESHYYPLTKYFNHSLVCPTDAPWFRFCTAVRNVQPCCWSGVFDNWAENSFEDIWNGQYLKGLREQISKGVYPQVCHCRY